MLGFFEPICKQVCTDSMYRWFGSYFWPELLRNTPFNFTPYLIGGTALLVISGITYSLTSKKGEVTLTPVEAEKKTTTPTQQTQTTRPQLPPRRSQPVETTTNERPTGEVTTTVSPTNVGGQPNSRPIVVDTRLKRATLRVENPEATLQAMQTHEQRLMSMLSGEGQPTIRALQPPTESDASPEKITEAEFVRAYLNKFKNISVRTRYYQGGPRGKADALKEIFAACELRFTEMPTTNEDQAQLREVYNRLR